MAWRASCTGALRAVRQSGLKDNGVETQFEGFVGRAHASGDPVNAKERARLWVEWVRDHIGGATTVHP